MPEDVCTLRIRLEDAEKLGSLREVVPRVLLQYKYQEPPLSVDAIVDTDLAGCRRTRKSSNGSCVMHGTHLIKNWATTQTVIAMSSGEAAYRGVVKGACEAVGIVSLLQDLTGRRSNVCEHRLERGSRQCDAPGRGECTAL